MKFKIYLIILLLFASQNYAQQENTDSLFNLARKLAKQNDRSSIDSSFHILMNNIQSIDSGLIYNYYSDLNSKNDIYASFKANFLLANYYDKKNKLDSAEKYYIFGKPILKIDTNLYAENLLPLSVVYFRKGLFDEGINTCIDILNKVDTTSKYAYHSYTRLIAFYSETGFSEKAEYYAKKSYNYCLNSGDSLSIFDAMTNLINVYLVNQSLDNAVIWSKKALNLAEELNRKDRLGKIYSTLAHLNYIRENYNEALRYSKMALEMEKQTDNNVHSILTYMQNIADCYIKLDNLKESIKIYKEMLKLDKNHTFEYPAVFGLKNAYNGLLDNNITNNDNQQAKVSFKRFNYYSKYLDSLDRIINKEKQQKVIADATIKYETERIENEKNLETKKRELAEIKQAKSLRSIYYLIISTVVILFFTIMLIVQNSYKKTINKKLEERELKLTMINKDLFDKNDRLIKSIAFKDKLLSVISHDLQTPVQSIKMLSDRIITDADKFEKPELINKAELFSEISGELQLLLNNLLNWIKSQGDNIKVEKTDFNIFELAEDIINIYKKFANDNNLQLINTIDKSLEVNADRNMIATVIRNLLSNAIKFSEKEGKIIIGSDTNKNEVKIFIKDYGVGISKENLKEIFTFNKSDIPMELDAKGSGLGLKISKEFIEMNGGEIYASSTQGEGSEFGFLLSEFKTF